jgi:tRNA A37 threonylcarbamoyladenosine dehydratase
MSESELEAYRLHRRFDRMGRLVGDAAMEKLLRAHVLVVGLGGVGSFAAESLVRSGVGRLTIVDFDEVCITNFNRQLHALGGKVGEKKALVMAERLRTINPQARIEPKVEFYSKHTSAALLEGVGAEDFAPIDFVVDAIDSVTSKCHLIARCRDLQLPLVTCMGTGGRMDPTRLRVTDLGVTTVDPLARSVRQILRERYGFPASGEYGIPAVSSAEPTIEPKELHYDGGKGFRCVCPQGDNPYFNCDNRNLIWGNASFVTGAAGLAAASVAVRALCES